MPIFSNYSRFKIIGHTIFWLCSIAFAISAFYVASNFKLSLNGALLARALLPNIGFALAVYVNLYILVPKFLKAKKYIFYTFWLVVLLAVSSLLIQAIVVIAIKNKNFTDQFADLFSSHFFTAAFYVGITSLAKFIKDWIQLQELNLKYARVEREKLEAELTMLKSQLNPHFLFNCLNNIYSLALTKSTQTPEIILKLSDLMRYVLYESRENFIPVKREIEFIKNFIELQKIRLSEKIDILVDIPSQIPDKKIIPLIFEPFVDNAFKHGIRNPAPDPFIHVSIAFSEERMHFKIENNYLIASTQSGNKASGIGLDNIRRRLAYLYQPGEYNYLVNRTDHIFGVELEIKLK